MDPWPLHEIHIQFAGFSLAPCSGLAAAGGFLPKRLFCSFQFFTCVPVRTEVMSVHPYHLNDNNAGEHCVLTRADGPSYGSGGSESVPLAIRIEIDTAPQASCPTEAREFHEYLKHRTLYIDVWDADSLLYLGTSHSPDPGPPASRLQVCVAFLSRSCCVKENQWPSALWNAICCSINWSIRKDVPEAEALIPRSYPIRAGRRPGC